MLRNFRKAFAPVIPGVSPQPFARPLHRSSSGLRSSKLPQTHDRLGYLGRYSCRIGSSTYHKNQSYRILALRSIRTDRGNYLIEIRHLDLIGLVPDHRPIIMAILICSFSVDYVATDATMKRAVGNHKLLRCSHFCDHVLDTVTSARWFVSTHKRCPPEEPRLCPVLAQAQKEQRDAAKAAAKEASGDDDDQEPAAKKRRTDRAVKAVDFGLTAQQLKDFPPTWREKDWDAVIAKIVGRSQADLKIEDLEARLLGKGGAAAEKDEANAARSSIRALAFEAAPRSGLVRHVAGLVSCASAAADLGADEPRIEKADLCAGTAGDVPISEVISESLFHVFEVEGRNVWVKGLFLKLLAEQKADAIQYVISTTAGGGGGAAAAAKKLVAIPPPERYASILLGGHRMFLSKIPITAALPKFRATLLHEWSLPCRDTILPMDLTALFLQAGVLAIAARAVPEDPDVSAALTTLETYIRYAFGEFREAYVLCKANLEQHTRFLAQKAQQPTRDAGRDKGGDGGRGRGRGGGRGTGGRYQAHRDERGQQQQQRDSGGGPPAAPSPDRDAVLHQPAALSSGALSGGARRHTEPIAGDRKDERTRYVACQAPGCTRKPPSGWSFYPFCNDHAPKGDGGRGGGGGRGNQQVGR